MKKFLCMLCILVLSFSLAACASTFDGTRTGNDREFWMEYEILNKTDSQDLNLQSGDSIDASIVVEQGALAIQIQKGDDKPIYESSGIRLSNTFQVAVEESGTYTVTVTGNDAKGSVHFTAASH